MMPFLSPADIRAATNDGDTPLHEAAEEGHLNIVEYLVDRAAHVNAATTDEKARLMPLSHGRGKRST